MITAWVKTLYSALAYLAGGYHSNFTINLLTKGRKSDRCPIHQQNTSICFEKVNKRIYTIPENYFTFLGHFVSYDGFFVSAFVFCIEKHKNKLKNVLLKN